MAYCIQNGAIKRETKNAIAMMVVCFIAAIGLMLTMPTAADANSIFSSTPEEQLDRQVEKLEEQRNKLSDELSEAIDRLNSQSNMTLEDAQSLAEQSADDIRRVIDMAAEGGDVDQATLRALEHYRGVVDQLMNSDIPDLERDRLVAGFENKIDEIVRLRSDIRSQLAILRGKAGSLDKQARVIGFDIMLDQADATIETLRRVSELLQSAIESLSPVPSV